MFARLAAISTLALAALAAAGNAGVCNTGSMECCRSLVDSKSEKGSFIRSLLKLDVQDVTGQIGVDCTPHNAVVGVGLSSECKATPVCCKDTQAGGTVGIGCVPVSL